jgi:hypothetical protein
LLTTLRNRMIKSAVPDYLPRDCGSRATPPGAMLNTPLRIVGRVWLAGRPRPKPAPSIRKPAIWACAALQGRVRATVTEKFFVIKLGGALWSATEG